MTPTDDIRKPTIRGAELAARLEALGIEVPSGTRRWFVHEGAIPPPTGAGPSAKYSELHVGLFAAVADLQRFQADKGVSFNAAELLRKYPDVFLKPLEDGRESNPIAGFYGSLIAVSSGREGSFVKTGPNTGYWTAPSIRNSWEADALLPAFAAFHKAMCCVRTDAPVAIDNIVESAPGPWGFDVGSRLLAVVARPHSTSPGAEPHDGMVWTGSTIDGARTMIQEARAAGLHFRAYAQELTPLEDTDNGRVG